MAYPKTVQYPFKGIIITELNYYQLPIISSYYVLGVIDSRDDNSIREILLQIAVNCELLFV